MFWKKFWEKRKMKEKEPDYDVESENLAIPEVASFMAITAIKKRRMCITTAKVSVTIT